MTLVRWHRPEGPQWTPFRQLSTLRDEIDRLFESPLSALSGVTQPFFGGWCPAVDLFEEPDRLTFRAEVPGMRKEDIEISLHEGVLTVSGERKLAKDYEKAEAHRTERFFGRFQRSLALPTPVDADKVRASYKDGILTVELPKTEAAKPRQIKVHHE